MISPPESSGSRRHFIQISLLLIITLVVFYPLLSAKFTNLDDVEMMMRFTAPDVPISIRHLFFPSGIDRYYRPLLISSFLLDKAIWQQEPAGFHLTNYLLHAANALLLYFILVGLYQRLKIKQYLPPLFGALLFAVHPLTCESVAWISGRTDVMATFFCLAGFSFYLSDFRGRQVPVAICLLAGLLSKESALSLVPVILITELIICRREDRSIKYTVSSLLTWGIIMFVPLLCYWEMRTGGIFKIDHGTQVALSNKVTSFTAGSSHSYNILPYVVNTGAAIAFYIKKLFIPFPLNFAINRIASLPYFFIFTVLTFIITNQLLKKKIALAAWSLVMIMGFAPALLVANSNIAWTPFAERYLYLACAIWAAAILFNLNNFLRTHPNYRKSVLLISSAIIAVWSGTTFQRTFVWHNDLSLWSATIKSSPDSGKVMYKYGCALLAHARKKEGLQMLTRAAKLTKDKKWQSYALIALGDNALRDNADADLNYYREALTANNGYQSQQALAAYYQSRQAASEHERSLNITKAVKYYRLAYAKKAFPNYLYQIAILLRHSDPQEARRMYKEIIKKHPQSEYAIFAKQCLVHFKDSKTTTGKP